MMYKSAVVFDGKMTMLETFGSRCLAMRGQQASFRLRGYVFYDFNQPEELPEADATLAQALC